MRWLTILCGVMAVGTVLFGGLAFVGSRLPRDHVVSRRALIHRPPAQVFAAIRDFARAAEWRSDVKRVTLLGETNGRLRFREEGTHGAMTLELVEEIPAQRLVTRITDEDLPFSGSWTYELKPAAGGTELVITERGVVKPAIFRALSKYVFTHHRTIEQYLRALGARLGDDVKPEAAGLAT